MSIREKSSHVIQIEILYFDIQFFCHSADRPAFFMGKGEFEAIYYTGNYDINDTIVEKVIEYEAENSRGNLLHHNDLYQVPLLDFEFTLPSIDIYNAEAGIGLNLLINEDFDEGVFTLHFSFPEKYYPNVLGYNR